MKNTKLTVLTCVLPLAAALVITAGCKTEGGANDATAAGLQGSADRINMAGGKVDSTLGSLSNLVYSPTNLPVQFGAFNSSVKDLESTAKEVNAKVTAMREKGNDYFKQWDTQVAQIKNEDIKNRSLERKNEMQERFTKIKMSYQQASDSYKPFMSDLKDIQAALTTDLTAGGVSAIKGAAQKASDHAVPLKQSIADLAAQFKELGVAMSSAAPVAAAAGTNAPAAK